jgi:hypothetical protein
LDVHRAINLIQGILDSAKGSASGYRVFHLLVWLLGRKFASGIPSEVGVILEASRQTAAPSIWDLQHTLQAREPISQLPYWHSLHALYSCSFLAAPNLHAVLFSPPFETWFAWEVASPSTEPGYHQHLFSFYETIEFEGRKDRLLKTCFRVVMQCPPSAAPLSPLLLSALFSCAILLNASSSQAWSNLDRHWFLECLHSHQPPSSALPRLFSFVPPELVFPCSNFR